MGLEKEKLDTSIIMDEDEFNRSIEPILKKKKKKKGNVYTEDPDRDPNDINAHLKVKPGTWRGNYALKVKRHKGSDCQVDLSKVICNVTLLFSWNKL